MGIGSGHNFIQPKLHSRDRVCYFKYFPSSDSRNKSETNYSELSSCNANSAPSDNLSSETGSSKS